MIEMIGDFDVGQETITTGQKQATLGVISAVQMRFNLTPQDMKFHSEMSSKTCPGTSFDKTKWICEVAAMTGAGGSPRSSDALFADQFRRGASLIQDLLALPWAVDDMASGEHVVGYEMFETENSGGRGGSPSGAEPSPQMIEALADHVVNLESGHLWDSGRIGTTEADVDCLFEELTLRKSFREGTQGAGAASVLCAWRPRVGEERLHGAFVQLRFWRENNAYPVFFIWDTCRRSPAPAPPLRRRISWRRRSATTCFTSVWRRCSRAADHLHDDEAAREDDTVTPAYRQSLLYLIYEALEDRRKTEILGLEISLHGDKPASDIFGIRGTPSKLGKVVWSPSRGSDFGSASDSRTHGGFDNDAATMNSVVRRVLDRRDAEPISPVDDGGARGAGKDPWSDQLDVSA
ncbi:N-acetylmuramoyl-L-alanine amidase [Aurantimonas sp. HBX-1]|uniref:peptidoglycan recognition protein family protein n=1 Tax=Aurantimonas sp. HBX-1 TaxID=2906072 RepID=UPI00351CC08E